MVSFSAWTFTGAASRAYGDGWPIMIIYVANAVGFFVWCLVLSLLASTGGGSIDPHAPGVFLYNTLASITDEVLNFSPAGP